MSEGAEAHQVVGTEPRDELLCAGTQQRQVALHAPRDIQHHDEPDRLGIVVEQRDRLGPPSSRISKLSRTRFVTSRPSRSVTVTKTRTASPSRGRWAVARSDAEPAKKAGGEHRVREEPSHSYNSIGRPAVPLSLISL